MSKPTDFTLRIATEPEDEGPPLGSSGGATPQPTQRKRRRKSRGVRRVSPEEIEREIAEINRLNGVGGPAIYRGDDP